jgi:3-methyladenine DNA glycosylase AlkD
MSLEEIVRELRAIQGHATVPQIRQIARRAGKNQPLAEQLWTSGVPGARILAAMTGDPQLIKRSTMDRWTRDFDSWWVCDACCYDLFDRSPHAWEMIPKWAARKAEFERRAAFATIAAIAMHDKKADDQIFLDALPLIEKYAFDDRNFVRKGVNWALRGIGKRNPALGIAAIACGERIKAQNTRAARWIAADALRELKRKYQC